MTDAETEIMRDVYRIMRDIRNGKRIYAKGKVFDPNAEKNHRIIEGRIRTITLCVSRCGVCPRYLIDTDNSVFGTWANEVEIIKENKHGERSDTQQSLYE